jgi:hypothetical protein
MSTNQDKEDHVTRLQTDKTRVEEKNKKLTKELADLTDSINSNRIVKDLREKLADEKDRWVVLPII